MLDEFYLKDVSSRDEAKKHIKEKYDEEFYNGIKFAKPRKKDGVYSILMKSDNSFYHRFYDKIDTYCFMCHSKIEGKEADYYKKTIESEDYYFCSRECRDKYKATVSKYNEGEYQVKCIPDNMYGYIYLMYNKCTNIYYIGQTQFLPFFRWQEHIKTGGKGHISDMVFSILAEVGKDLRLSNDENQDLLNDIESWWINKFIEEGQEVYNLTIPKIKNSDLIKRFRKMIKMEEGLINENI
ncbi:MAG: GIY-YIG nuclease family protein [Tissierellales bacterium]|jgi:YHS domain-containing protein|nr:GIY-YIG nuclease family protein [Tissierellales bacterium]